MLDDPTSSQAGAALAPDASLPHPTEPRSAIASLVQKALVTVNERQRHRRVLINLLILAQALLVVAAAPGYIGDRPSVAALVAVLAGLFVCLLAAGFNQWGRDTTRATYVLVVGSGLVVLAQVFLAAATGTPAQAAQASLLLLTVILEAGLFFAPVLTVLLAGGSIALTIVAFVVAVVLARSGSGRETYGLIVGTLGLQTVTGLVAWLLAQFIYDSALEAQRAQDAQFAHARLETTLAQQAQRQRQTQEVASGIHQATARAMAGDARARAAAVEGDLGAIVRDVNVLLQRLAIASADGAGTEPGDFAALAPAPVAAASGTEPATPIEASQAMRHELLARRLERVRELASELGAALAHSQDGLDATASATAEAQRAAGASVALAHELLASAQQAAELIARARRALAPQTQAEAGRAPANGAGEPVSLQGLGTDLGVAAPGLTGQFQVLPNGELADVDAPGAPGAPPESAGAPDLPELEAALSALRDAVAAQERGASTLTQDLGLMSRQVRGIDGRVAWARQAIDAVRRNTERLYLTAGGAAQPPAAADEPADRMPPVGDMPEYGPTASRPLADALGNYPSLPPSALEPPAATQRDGAAGDDADPREPAPDDQTPA
ncbi:MAG TPA: hypothetical protein VGR57_18540 [Ktedonobacterales bacterium]|nr:hypothetical protein [Ktedonobacterales bacterium]